ncbi:MAG: YigZ family protein [Candidatus Cloacimonetes bacterium]|nr:YigZ family protein [Candidatus Cloacimonadota bacterium]
MAYDTISTPVTWQQKIRRSTFICSLHPIASADEARSLISAHLKENSAATHNCFAYICGFERETQYHSDAGEPHGTAGKPILNALLRAGITNVLAIVTRFYGGVKLGVPGLIQAYGGTVEQTLRLAPKLPAVPFSSFRVKASYAVVDQLIAVLKSLEGSVSQESWAEKAELVLLIPTDNAAPLREFLDGQAAQSHLEYLEENDHA